MRRIAPLILFTLITACGGESTLPTRPDAADEVPDLNGHWEMDYGRSDNVDAKLNLMYREWLRQQERRARADQRSRQGPAVSVGANRSFRSIVDTARMADLITSSQVLDIVQTDLDIEIKRENDFTLTCVFSAGEPEIVDSELGAEICGWDAHQLIFRMLLPDGLSIRHRVTVSDDRNRLHIATRVSSKSGPPFTLNRFYFRFNPLPENYSCEYTLSRGNVCQRGTEGT